MSRDWDEMKKRYNQFVDRWKTVGQPLWSSNDIAQLTKSQSPRGVEFRAIIYDLDKLVEAFEYFVERAEDEYVQHDYTCEDCNKKCSDEAEPKSYDQLSEETLLRIVHSLLKENEQLRTRLREQKTPTSKVTT